MQGLKETPSSDESAQKEVDALACSLLIYLEAASDHDASLSAAACGQAMIALCHLERVEIDGLLEAVKETAGAGCGVRGVSSGMLYWKRQTPPTRNTRACMFSFDGRMDYAGHFLTKWKQGECEPDITNDESDRRITTVACDGTTYAYSIPRDDAQDFSGWVASVWGSQADEPPLMQNWQTPEESAEHYRDRVDRYLDRIGVTVRVHE